MRGKRHKSVVRVAVLMSSVKRFKVSLKGVGVTFRSHDYTVAYVIHEFL